MATAPQPLHAMASHAELAAKQAQLGKAARDQELSRRQKEQADKKKPATRRSSN
jgi:Skp family chaperone for outer membrane proteins